MISSGYLWISPHSLPRLMLAAMTVRSSGALSIYPFDGGIHPFFMTTG
ncbi:hypothetical protein [Novacetimonas hansenii]|nr:hypothetical protein [Novacetimonas hansenii]